MMTVVPPAVGPLVGLSEDTVGAPVNVNWSPDEVAEVPPAVVTVTSTVPADSAGDVAVICVPELTVKVVAAVPPKFTALAPDRLVPVMMTVVPPAVGPLVGLSEDTVGAATNVNWSPLEVAEVPPAVVTVTSTVPADSAGEVAVIVVPLTTETPVAAVPPKETVAGEAKLVPVMVTDVPPEVGPWFGLTALTVGPPETRVYWSKLDVAEVPDGLVTVTSTVPLPDGAVAVIDVAELTVNVVAGVDPKFTAVA